MRKGSAPNSTRHALQAEPCLNNPWEQHMQKGEGLSFLHPECLLNNHGGSRSREESFFDPKHILFEAGQMQVHHCNTRKDTFYIMSFLDYSVSMYMCSYVVSNVLFSFLFCRANYTCKLHSHDWVLHPSHITVCLVFHVVHLIYLPGRWVLTEMMHLMKTTRGISVLFSTTHTTGDNLSWPS